MLTPEGLWVACRLELKRTRNPSCFRSTPLLRSLEAGQHAMPVETLHDATTFIWASEVHGPATQEAGAIATLDISGVDVTGL
jgi:hypothetical protein